MIHERARKAIAWAYEIFVGLMANQTERWRMHNKGEDSYRRFSGNVDYVCEVCGVHPGIGTMVYFIDRTPVYVCPAHFPSNLRETGA
jgi:hypothetical protein